MWQALKLIPDCYLKLLQSPVSSQIGPECFFQVWEVCSQASEVDDALAVLLLILDDQQRTSVAEQLDDL